MTEQKDNPSIDYVRLDDLMREKGWKVSDLAHYSKVKYDTVYSIVKRTRNNPAADTLIAICGALGCTVDYLLGTSNNRHPSTDKLPKQVRELARIADRLSEVRQEELLRIAAALEKLEREQEERPLANETMRALVEIAERIRESGTNEDVLPLLETLLRGAPRPWLVDQRSALSQGSHDPNQNH